MKMFDRFSKSLGRPLSRDWMYEECPSVRMWLPVFFHNGLLWLNSETTNRRLKYGKTFLYLQYPKRKYLKSQEQFFLLLLL